MTDKKSEAYRAAVRLLSASDKTPAALVSRLVGKGFDEGEANDAVLRLTAEGYVNETRLAENTVQRLYEQYYGEEYIVSYMTEKQFSEDTLDSVRDMMKELDFNKKAKEYYASLIRAGKSRALALSSLHRRGYTVYE